MNKVNRIIIAALALSAPVAAHAACDITTIPVSNDEVKAAGLGPLMEQADKEASIGTREADKLIMGKNTITEQDEREMSTKFAAVREVYGKRMIVIAVAARCGAAAAEQAMRLRTGTEVTVPWYPLFNRMHAAVPAHAQTATCSTSFHQGYRFCDDLHGHRCIEWEHDPAEDLVAHPPQGHDSADGACPMTPQEENK